MKYKLIIKGKLPCLNDWIKATNKYRLAGASMKRTEQKCIEFNIKEQLKDLHITKPVILKYDFYEPNRKRDLDGISSFAHKVIQDALVCSGVLENDGWKNIVGMNDQFYLDKENPRIEITITEV